LREQLESTKRRKNAEIKVAERKKKIKRVTKHRGSKRTQREEQNRSKCGTFE
jgi:hypothetical protein